jgi:CheY-like chemotaxis protein
MESGAANGGARKGGGEPAKVLVIDDNPAIVLTLQTFLDDHGYRSYAAYDIMHGMEMIRSLHPDLIVLDIMVDKPYAGFYICAQVKGAPDLRDIPIIGISGLAEQLGIQYSPEKDRNFFDPDAFLEKPINLDLFLEKIEALLQRQ